MVISYDYTAFTSQTQLKSLAQIQSVLTATKNLQNVANQRETLKSIGRTYTTETLKAALAQSTLNKAQMKTILLANGLQGELLETTAAELANAASTHAVAEAQKKAGASTLGFSTALKGLWIKIKSVTASLWAFLTTNPVGWLTLVAGAFAAAAFGVKKYNDHLEEVKQKTREAAAEAREAADSIKSDFDSLSSATDKVKRRYAELAQEVENLGQTNQSRGTLSTEDYSEFLSLGSQLAELFPQLTSGYDENGNAILGLSGNIDTIVDSLNDLVDVQQRMAKQQILDKMSDIWAGYTLEAEEYRDALNDAQEFLDNTMEAISQINSSRGISYDMITNGRFQHKGEVTNMIVHDAAMEAGIGNIGNDWNGTFQVTSRSNTLTPNQVDTSNITWDFSSLTDDQFHLLQTKLGVLSSEYETSVMLARNKVAAADAEFSDYLNTWLSMDPIYETMDSGLRSAARAMLFDLDWIKILPDGIDTDDWDDVSAWIQENFLYRISSLQKDPQISRALSEVFTNAALTPPEKGNYLEQLQEYFGEDDIFMSVLQPRLQEAEELQARYQDALSRFGEASRDMLAGFFQRHSINSPGEIDYWNQVTDGAHSATEAVTQYLKSMTAPLKPADPSQTIDQLNTRLRPAFESLGSAYRDIFADDGFNPGAVDLPMLDSIRSSIEELNSLQDVDINIDIGAFDALASTLTAAGVTQGQAEQAFNDFATSVFYASYATAGMTGETRGLVEQLLESLGVANAAEAAGYALLEAKAQSVLAAHDLADASREECASLLAEGVAAGLTRQQIYGLTAAEIAYGQSGLSTEQKIQRLKDLAAAYGDTASAALATAIANDLASGHTDVDSAMDGLMARMNAGIRKARLDFSGLDRAAAKAGSSAGRSYADALKEELSGLNSVISYIGGVIGDQIDLFNDQKDAAVEALEAEKQAAQEALEAEKALVQEKIDARQEEIDRIREAASARKEEISLQKAQYDLARMQGQQAVLQYSHGRGMHYVTDTEGLREAREAYTEAKENIRVSGIQKEISGLQDTVDGLDRKLEESARHYDSLIEQTEKYWDGLIQGLENYKSRWQELAGIEEQAKMEAALRNLGITSEDVLNLSESAFEAFKGHYLGVLQEIHANNEDVLQMLQRFGGVSADALRPLAGSLATVTENIRDASTAIGGRAGNPAKDPSLTDSIVLLGETAEETLGEPDGDGTTGRFTELGRTIAAAGTHVAEVANGMESLDGMTAECTITVNIETTGSIPEVAVGTGIADAVNSGIPGSKSHTTASGNNTPSKNNAPAKGNSPSKGSIGQGTATKVRGHASVAGDWNVREAGRILVGELGRELWVHAKDGTFETVGDSGAEFIRTEKGDLILSHQQTEELLAVGRITEPADAPTVPNNTPAVSETISAASENTTAIPGNAPTISPYDPANDPTPFGDAVRKWDAAMAKLDAQARADLLNTSVVSYDRDRQIQETINRINNTSISTQNVRPNINVGGISITCPGVTSQAVMREVKTALNREFNGLHNFADQWVRR